MSTVLVIDANHDEATRRVSTLRAGIVYGHFEKLGYDVNRLSGSRAVRARVAQAAAAADIVYVTGVGHGEADRFNGHADLPVFQVGRYPGHWVAERVVHLVSCLVARSLGTDFVANKCHAFFGYDDYFSFTKHSVRVCVECDAEVDLGFAEGETARQVHRRVFDAYTVAIADARAEGRTHVAATLEHNRDHLCSPTTHALYGRLSSRIGKRRKGVGRKRPRVGY